MRFLDYEGLGHLIEELKIKFVQEQTGKGLSANDFTNILKDKLDGLESGAQVNTVDRVNGKVGDVTITSADIEFLSSTSGASPTTVRAIIDSIIAKDKAQDIEMSKKADKLSTYTKTEVDGRIGDIDAGVISVNNYTGNVTLNADDIDDKTTTSKFVTEDDKNIWNNKADVSYVDGEADKKVDKVVGKSLSTNDFTTALRNKLNAIEEGAQVNVIELIKKNGTNLTVTGKAVDIDIPTKISQLTNDKTYQTKTEIQALISEQGKLKKEVVISLPDIASADDNTLYMIRNKQDSGYEEWMAINGAWEILGDTAAVDFTGYIHQDDISKITNAEIDTFLNA